MPGKAKSRQAKDEIAKMDLARDARACNDKIDPRLCFLERARARLILFYADEMTLDEAYGGLVASLQCACSREMVERWEREYPWQRPRNRRAA